MKIYAMIAMCLVLLSMVEIVSKYPNSGFISPVNSEIKLSGTFGELRTNHFHSGLDIKSKNGASGDPVYATADGFISRVKVEEYGYGNALYLEHPNGYTSVYAHLEKFSPEIEQYVKSEQYKKKSFEVDLYLPKNQFMVLASQQIGSMGNSGYSFGPHLHFEIRHTEGQVPVNPLHFGLEVEDRTPPVVQQLIVYSYDEKGVLTNTSIHQPTYSSRGEYTFNDPLEMGAPMVAFGLRTFDTQEGSTNKNGVYGIQCKVDDEPSFAFTLDEIPFEQTRYVNAHIDYSQKLNDNKSFHRCHPLEGNKLPIYYTGLDKGMTYLNAELPRSVRLEVSDFKGNKSTLAFEIKRNKTLLPTSSPSNSCLTMGLPDKVSTLSLPGLQVVWPKGSFYEKTPINVDIIPAYGIGCYSPMYLISPLDVPVHFYFDVYIEGLSVPARLREKVFIARCEADGDIVNCGGTWVGNNLTTGVRQMSTYTIMADTVAPTISVLHFGPKMTGWNRMAFKIDDNLTIKDRGKDLVYNAWVDGEWILMSLDGKSGILTHQFDGRILPGEHHLLIRVTDDRRNEAILEKTFTL